MSKKVILRDSKLEEKIKDKLQGVFDEKRQESTKLSGVLNKAIDKKVFNSDKKRSEVIKEMADAAGITINAVHDILNSRITCPPRERLQGFAKVLPVSLGSLISASKSDGCDL